MTLNVNIKQKGGLEPIIVNLPMTIDRIAEEAANAILEEAHNILKTLNFDTQSLAESGGVEADGNSIKIEFGAGHAGWVEFGRDPGIRPSPKRVAKWLMDNKGIRSERYALKIAEKFCSKVERRGIPATPFLRPARAQGAQIIESKITEIESKLGGEA